jgi:hypothetical protein
MQLRYVAGTVREDVLCRHTYQTLGSRQTGDRRSGFNNFGATINAKASRIVCRTVVGWIGADDPHVADLRDAMPHVLVMATEPNGNRPLDRKRIEPNIRQLVPFSRKLDMRLGPQGFEYLDLLVRPLTPITKIIAQRCELDRVQTDSYPKAQSPVQAIMDYSKNNYGIGVCSRPAAHCSYVGFKLS